MFDVAGNLGPDLDRSRWFSRPGAADL